MKCDQEKQKTGAAQFGRRLWKFGARSSPLLLQDAWGQWSRECLEHLCNKQIKQVAWCMDLQTPPMMLLLHIENLTCCRDHRWEIINPAKTLAKTAWLWRSIICTAQSSCSYSDLKYSPLHYNNDRTTTHWIICSGCSFILYFSSNFCV